MFKSVTGKTSENVAKNVQNAFNKNHNSRVKIIFAFSIILIIALSVKVFLFSNAFATSQNDPNDFKNLIAQECIHYEEKNLSKGDNLDDDIEWLKTKAPEYCKCVSQKTFSYLNEEEEYKNIISEKRFKEFKEKISHFIRTDLARDLANFCMSKAQRARLNNNRVPASQ